MPRGDRTGPEGHGPMTGRAAGFCAGYQTAGFAHPAGGRGMGWRRGGGFGRGRGRGFAAYPATNPDVYPSQQPVAEPVEVQGDELKALREQATFITRSLEAVNERIEKLEAARVEPEPKTEQE